MTISEKIFKLMKEKNISQLEMSKRTGISQSTISDWRTKNTNPAADKIVPICNALGITPNELLLESPEGKTKADQVITVDKGTDQYEILVEYNELNENAKGRIAGYMKALSEAKMRKKKS